MVIRVWALKRKFPQIQLIESHMKLLKICLASAVSVGAGIAVNRLLIASIWLPRTLYLLIAVIAACVIYLGLLMLFKIDEIKMLKSIVSK